MPDSSAHPASETLIDDLRGILGADGVITDDTERTFFAQDVYNQAPLPLAVLRPGSVEDLAKAVKHLSEAGIAMFPRGGGMSYTDAYLPFAERAVVIDTGGLDQILEVNTTDMFVTVEAGVSWLALDEHLKGHGVRARFWGPFSGMNATVGGSMSQGSITYGSGKHGASADNVLGFDIITANGDILTTGSGGQPKANRFFRQYGPDVTGLFCNDAGTLGIKARITLPLVQRPEVVDGLSFAFDSYNAMADGMAAAARTGLASESFGMDAAVMKQFTGGQDLATDFKTLLKVGQAGRTWLGGLIQMAKIVLTGKKYLQSLDYSAHFILEAEDPAGMRSQMRAIRRAVEPFGKELDNAVPSVVRAFPFPPFNLFGPEGVRWVPLHGVLPFSKTSQFKKDLDALYDRYADQMAQHKVTKAAMFSTIATHGFLFEPVFYWEDQREDFHRRVMDDALLNSMPEYEPNPEGRALVKEMKQAIVDLFHETGGTHFQIGKAYPWTRERNPQLLEAVRAVKAQTDPKGLFNPGGLGL